MSSPPADPVDRSFVRFARTGDPGALARVFDQTAPELLRVASHLVSDLNLAEDLVQATFLSAIESSGEYDPGRPLLQWLTGIMTNRARELRRKIDRQPDPERLSPNHAQEPLQEAAASEFTEALSHAIANLPELYRPVLLMHLKLGQPIQGIALVLGRAPGLELCELGMPIPQGAGVLYRRGVGSRPTVTLTLLAVGALPHRSTTSTGLTAFTGPESAIEVRSIHAVPRRPS